MNVTRTIMANLLESRILAVDERITPPAAQTSQHQAKKKISTYGTDLLVEHTLTNLN